MNCQKQSCSFPLQLERDWKLNHSVSQHPQFRRDSTCLRSRGLAGRAKTGNPNHQLTNLEGVLFLATGSKATSSSATPIGRWDQRVPKAQTQTIVSFNHRGTRS
ncbi:hypothetical protein CDAR_82981 [Caerostris darwini]|uniref:Uncharacterized protein n=1 Tax=Caerostris darwini TaxID=1538125 RepID=A0AAV4NVQ2_9ARAC|nr:hypothetical protein CDAR_82981 [Caerostris darwini]